MEIRETEHYRKWFASLRDRTARVRIDIRIRRLLLGNPGDVEPVGKGVSELRFNFGPGYRVYYVQHENECIYLLTGGDKATQSEDIPRALALASDL